VCGRKHRAGQGREGGVEEFSCGCVVSLCEHPEFCGWVGVSEMKMSDKGKKRKKRKYAEEARKTMVVAETQAKTRRKKKKKRRGGGREGGEKEMVRRNATERGLVKIELNSKYRTADNTLEESRPVEVSKETN